MKLVNGKYQINKFEKTLISVCVCVCKYVCLYVELYRLIIIAIFTLSFFKVFSKRISILKMIETFILSKNKNFYH